MVRKLANGETGTLQISISGDITIAKTVSVSFRYWHEQLIKAAYIPVKDMMANAPGFLSLYQEREIHFEEIYADIVRKALLPPLRKPLSTQSKNLLDKLQRVMGGEIEEKNQEFFPEKQTWRTGIHAAGGGLPQTWPAVAADSEWDIAERIDTLLGRAGGQPQPEADEGRCRNADRASAHGSTDTVEHT